MRNEEKGLQQILRAKEIEMQDVAAAYKSCAEENDRMMRKISELKAGETSQYENFRKCENELIALRFERDSLMHKQKELLEEIGTLEQHVQHLNKELERAYANYTSLQQQSMKMSESQKNMKNVTTLMEASQDEVRRKLANSSQELVNFNLIHRSTPRRSLPSLGMRITCSSSMPMKPRTNLFAWSP